MEFHAFLCICYPAARAAPHASANMYCQLYPAVHLLLTMIVKCPITPSRNAGYLDDLYLFDPNTGIWTLLSAAAADSAHRPSARYQHGFTSAGGKLYVHGGWNHSGGKCLVSQWVG